MPWSTLLRIRCTSGSPISSMMALSTRVVLALQDQLDLLALLAGQVAHQAREALEDVADGQHPDVHHRLLELRRHAAPPAGRRRSARARPRGLASRLRQVLAHLAAAWSGRRSARPPGSAGGRAGRSPRAPCWSGWRRSGRRRRAARPAAPSGRARPARPRAPRARERRPRAPGRSRRSPWPEQAVERGLLGREVARLAVPRAGLLHRVAQRAGAREEPVEDRGREPDARRRAIWAKTSSSRWTYSLMAVKPIIPLLPLRVCSGPEHAWPPPRGRRRRAPGASRQWSRASRWERASSR